MSKQSNICTKSVEETQLEAAAVLLDSLGMEYDGDAWFDFLLAARNAADAREARDRVSLRAGALRRARQRRYEGALADLQVATLDAIAEAELDLTE